MAGAEKTHQGNFLLGLAIGGTGTVAATILLSTAISQGSLSLASALITLALLSLLFIVPFLSALGLLFLPLKDDQRDILGFVALISSIVASVPTYFFLFFLYCNTIHSTCS